MGGFQPSAISVQQSAKPVRLHGVAANAIVIGVPGVAGGERERAGAGEELKQSQASIGYQPAPGYQL